MDLHQIQKISKTYEQTIIGTKPKRPKNILNQDPRPSSPPTCEKPMEFSDSFNKRQGQYELSDKLLKQGLPAKYFDKNFATPNVPTDFASESTVNESDLLKQFVPTNVSTPRSSSHLPEITANLSAFMNQLRHSDLSLGNVCSRFSQVGTSESFVGGEEAVAKLARHEQQWLNEHGPIGTTSIRNQSVFSLLENGNDMTDFFRKKSEFDDFLCKDSPEKDVAAPLVEDSCSVLSYTALENADTTAKVFEAIRRAGKENKPNKIAASVHQDCPPYDAFDKSISSVRTVSSLDNLTGGKLPIETNRSELAWGCIQIGKKALQTFIVRNRTSNKIHFQITSSNVCFRVFTDQRDFEAVSSLPVLLYPAESRLFRVMFVPTSLGAFVEYLSFTPVSDVLKSQQTRRQMLMLYGYGGHAQVDITNVAKDTSTRMWLSLGKFDNHTDLTQKFFVSNSGTLPAFVYFSFIPKVVCGYSKIVINPAELILPPRSRQSVTIEFTPTTNDVRHMLSTASEQVIEIGLLQVTMGAEPLRSRIRNLTQKYEKESGIYNNFIAMLGKIIPNEQVPLGIQNFTETSASLKELLQNVVRKEITITIERDSDSSILGYAAGIDETSFQSFNEGMITKISNKGSVVNCSVEPVNLILTLPIKTSDCILLTSYQSVPVSFRIQVLPDNILDVTPLKGILHPNVTFVVNVAYNISKVKKCNDKHNIVQVLMYVDEEVYEVSVKIMYLKVDQH